MIEKREKRKKGNISLRIIINNIKTTVFSDKFKNFFVWLFFSVIISLIPLYLAITQDIMTIEYTFEQIEEKYITDFLLAVFAIAANLLGSSVKKRFRIDGFVISFLSIIYCVQKYTHLHNPKTELLDGVLDKILVWALLALLLNTIWGFILQNVSDPKAKDEENSA